MNEFTQPPSIPPRQPDPPHHSMQMPRPVNGMFSTFGADFGPMNESPTPSKVVEALLKHPARVTHELLKGKRRRTTLVLLLIVAVCMSAYGLLMGFFSGGEQLWFVPVKVLAGTLLAFLICLPSLYIFACLSGSDQSFPEVVGLFLQSLALGGILLVGFAPVAWIFSQSTGTIGFMGFLHLLFWMVGMYFGLRLLSAAFVFLHQRPMKVLKLWMVIYVLVVMQMCTALRPLVGEFAGYRLQGKKFFLAHWAESLD